MGNQRYRKWTPELVEHSFRAFAAKHGRPPKHGDLGKHGLPWSRTVERLYGEDAFTKAMEAAGFTPRPIGQPRKYHGVRVAAR